MTEHADIVDIYADQPVIHADTDVYAGTDEDSGVIIIGAGFSGLCMAARLVMEGRRDFLLLEKGASVGGTWRDNRYPGCACDIPSHLYSLSFGPRPDWSRHYPTQPELRAYLEDFARHYDLDPNLRLGTAFADARWDEDVARWIVTAADGRTFSAPVLISAIGALHVPEKPRLAGVETFAGPVFHSAEWPDGFDATGKDIAVIGTGASAIQFVPQLAKTARSLTVFQRTAPWVLPKIDHKIGPVQQFLLKRVPGVRQALRSTLYWLHEARLLAFVGGQQLAPVAQGFGRAVINRRVPKGPLRDAVTPDYQLGCKRTLLSNDYYPAIARSNVHVTTSPIARVEPDAVLTADGTRHAAQAIVFGTGFKVVESLMTLQVRGIGGQLLREAWVDGPSAYMGISVNGFPNFFLMLGPNTGLGHNSQVVMIEAQAEHIIRTLRLRRRLGAVALEVRKESHVAFDSDTQRRLGRSVWTQGGCRSWYQDAAGRVVALWPRSTWRYRLLARHASARDYQVVEPRIMPRPDYTHAHVEDDHAGGDALDHHHNAVA